MTITPLDLSAHKIQIYEGINDNPVPPNQDGNGKGCNGAYLIDKFHGSLDTVSNYLGQLVDFYALYPEKELPFVPETPDFLSYGVYTLTEQDFGAMLTPNASLATTYTLKVTIPADLAIMPGLQTYFAVKGGCKIELAVDPGVSLYKFDNSPYIKPDHVWALVCTDVNSYSLYRITAPKTYSCFHPFYILSPELKEVPLLSPSKETTVVSISGLRLESGTATASVLVDGSAVSGLNNLSISTTPQHPVAIGSNIVSPYSRLALNITQATDAVGLEFTLETSNLL